MTGSAGKTCRAVEMHVVVVLAILHPGRCRPAAVANHVVAAWASARRLQQRLRRSRAAFEPSSQWMATCRNAVPDRRQRCIRNRSGAGPADVATGSLLRGRSVAPWRPREAHRGAGCQLSVAALLRRARAAGEVAQLFVQLAERRISRQRGLSRIASAYLTCRRLRAKRSQALRDRLGRE